MLLEVDRIVGAVAGVAALLSTVECFAEDERAVHGRWFTVRQHENITHSGFTHRQKYL